MAMRKEIVIGKSDVEAAAAQGFDAFLQLFVDATKQAIGGELGADGMACLNTSQVTLLAYDILRTEVMDGGFVQLIYNGYGAFMFVNPVAKVLKMWGMNDLAKLLHEGRKLYFKHKDEIERECSDEDFMALFERMPEFDDLDDDFVENEEEWTEAMATYVDEHIDDFAKVV